MSPRKPLGSTHKGLSEWLLQRVTAIYMAAFVLYVTVQFSLHPVSDYYEWKGWFTRSPVRIGWALFFLSALVHGWIGMRSVYMDYVKPAWLRFIVSTLSALALLFLALWTTQVLIEAVP